MSTIYVLAPILLFWSIKASRMLVNKSRDTEDLILILSNAKYKIIKSHIFTDVAYVVDKLLS